MSDLVEGLFLPKVDLACVSTKKDLNDPNLTFVLSQPIYLRKYPYNNNLLDATTVILFLCSLNYNDFVFEFRYNLSRKIEGNLCNCRIIIYDKPNGYRLTSRKKQKQKNKPKISSEEEDEPEPPPLKKIFKLLFDSHGNSFYLQILGTTEKVKYDLISFKRKCGTRPLYLYNYSFIAQYSYIKYIYDIFYTLNFLTIL